MKTIKSFKYSGSAICCLFVIMNSLISCSSDDENNKFKFGLNNSYRIENSNRVYETPNGYETDTTDAYAILLNDGGIGNTLELPCCTAQWTYTFNPTTEVLITFIVPKNELQSGVYTYRKDEDGNDFDIKIINNMRFQSLSEDEHTFTYDVVVDPNNSKSESKVVIADLRLVKESGNISVDYSIETENGLRVVGSFEGQLSGFTYVNCQADCD